MERNQKVINPELCHELLVEKTKQELSKKNGKSYQEWKSEIKDKLVELLRFDSIKKYACPVSYEIEWEEEREDYKIMRLRVKTEINEIVPCYMLIPKLGKKKYPVAITMQGHSTGFHLSIGENKYGISQEDLDRKSVAIQAVRNGFVAVAIEQRGMGERIPVKKNRFNDGPCTWTNRTGNMLGRVSIGERVWDIQRVIDILPNFPECDADKILITGNSGGGTISYYAACLDERIKLSVPSCGLCDYKYSIMAMAHCGCNYIPYAYKYFEMSDLACLIAPRNLIYVTGGKDPIFPVDGANVTFERIKQIYRENGVEDKCQLIVTPMAHWWCVDIIWEAINKECEKLGWK